MSVEYIFSIARAFAVANIILQCVYYCMYVMYVKCHLMTQLYWWSQRL